MAIIEDKIKKLEREIKHYQQIAHAKDKENRRLIKKTQNFTVDLQNAIDNVQQTLEDFLI